MNPILEAMHNRRSVRSYRSDPVPRETIEQVIEAGNMAATGANIQPWRFVVFDSTETLARLRDVAGAKYRAWFAAQKDTPLGARRAELDAALGADDPEYDPVFYRAPVVVYVIGTPNGGMASDCPMVCGNMMLAAHALGLGSCWVGFGGAIKDDPELVEALELEDGERVFGPILLGYPKAIPSPEKKPPVVKWL